ncbi:MAG: leucine-rich repeat protein, partial [Clostridia bacterium]|nr:leucine-rich repeat protein [Clostridia bacterium]
MMKTLIQNKKIRLGGSLLAAILLAGLLVFAFLQPQTARAYEADGFTYTVSGNEATITGTTLTGSITIPSTIGGYPVTSIGSEAFQNATDITGVTIPNSIISIGNSAFYGCTGLTVVTIPNSVTSIGRSVFYNCKNLSAVTVPASITSIGTSAFYNATTSSAQVNYLGTVAQWCSITFANTSASPVYSSKMLYINDTQLTQITAEDLAGITAIKSYSFSNCSGLTTVTIPDSVTSIGKNAFSGTAIANDNANWFGGGLYVDRCLVQVKADAEKLIVREDARLLEGDVLTGTSLSTVYLPYAIKSFPQAFFSNAGNSNAAAFQIVMTDATTIPVNAAFPANAVIVALPTAPAAQYCAANGVAFQSVYEAFPFAASTSDSSYTGILARYDIIATWQEAKVICEALGGHLAVILSDREHTLVQTMLTASTGFIGYYIGASDAENEGEWKWIDGEPFSYTNAWHEGEPSNSNGNEHYLEYWYHNETFAWNDSAGGSGGTGNRGFICEFNDPIVYTPSKTAVGENGHIYLVFNQSSAWETAKDYCESFGGHLVTITSAEENTFVANLVADQLKGLYWIGLKRSSNNTWDWVTGESGFPEDPWDNGEPSGGSEYYAQMYSRDCYTNGQNHPAGSWNDNENSGYNPGSYYRLANTGFVCEIEPETYHPTKKGYSGSTAYEVYANHTNWYVAKAVAEAKGGHLITIGSQDENAFITQLISTIEDPRFVGNDHQNEPHFWLGACRDSYNWPAGLEGYQWVTGERLSSAFDSGFFYPNELQSVNEFVLAVDRTGQWNDFDAIGKRATERYEHGCFFIVEYENHQETVAFINAVTGEQTESVQQGNQPVDTSAVDRPGYTTHCFTDAACSNPFVKDLENPVVDPIPLYYTFTPNSYTATLDPAGGHFVNYAVNDHDEAVKIVTFDARYGVLPTPVREGYTFAGWFAPDGRKVETVTVSPFDPATQTYTVQTPSDHVLTAHWIGNSYTVSFDCVGGALPSGAGPVSVVYGAAYGALPTPEKAGAVFTGWRLQGTETEITAESVVAIAANHVLVAQWRERMLQNVTLQGVPAETTYSLGESFDPTGLELVLHYDNGETELCNELTWSPAEFTETGDVAMTFYYEEWNWEDYATVTVTRGDPIGVTLQTGPQQTVYAIGD